MLFPDRQTPRIPNVGFIRKDRVQPAADHSRFPRLALDLAVEVFSPCDRMVDTLSKVYLQAGVRAVWLVGSDQRTMATFEPDQPLTILHERDTLDSGDALPGFRVTVAEIFA